MYRLTKFIRINTNWLIVWVVFLSVFFSVISILIFNMMNALESYNESQFTESGYLSGLEMKNSYYVNIFGLSVYTNDTKIISDVFMVAETVEYGGNYFTKYNGINIENSSLNTGEVAISRSLSSTKNIEIGDQLVVHINFQDYNYTVSYIFDDYYGLHSTNIWKAENLIILGYSNEIITNAADYDYYYFSNINSGYSNTIIFDKTREVNRLVTSIIFISLFLVFLEFLVLVFIILKSSKLMKKDIKALRFQGFTKKQLLIYTIIDTLYIYVPIYFICGVLVLVFDKIMYSISYLTFVLLFIGFIISIGLHTLQNSRYIGEVV